VYGQSLGGALAIAYTARSLAKNAGFRQRETA
jgi:alpha-beta hydrolase superfamily lysophospholipase